MIDAPRISIVTPSFNQARYLDQTIRSVLDQGHPNLEYIVIDGGSTDGSVEVIRKYEKQLAFWVSEPDAGQVDAINKGLRRATGEWVGWQNSDDIYFPGALRAAADTMIAHPGAALVIGNMRLIDAGDQVLRELIYCKPNHDALLCEGMVLTNQAAFWRRSVHDRIGYLNPSFQYCFDYEWFLRLTECTEGCYARDFWGGYRLHDETKTSRHAPGFFAEKARIMEGRIPGRMKRRAYQLRRVASLLRQGEFRYVLRGLMRRAAGRGEELY
jgi:glycosyltransferase involved in cell wall biosynthesis